MKKRDVSEEELRFLLERYLSGHASEEETKFVEDYYAYFDKEEGIYNSFPDEEKNAIETTLLQRIHQHIEGVPQIPVASRFRKIRLIASSAAALLIITASVFYYRYSRNSSIAIIAKGQAKSNVQPGHNGAVLHLSDGRTIVLDSAQNGTLAMQGNMRIVKENGALKYVGSDAAMVYNDVVTDKGREWQLVLPDGTKVWLNASSSIHYPLAFDGKERRVTITGEVYFEVVHNAAQPFRVVAGNQVIEDIGTAFNVNAYSDEPAIKTTLAEGALAVNGKKLSPGQQYENGAVHTVNVEEVTAWKNGYFEFNHADIKTVMKQLARWYDLEIVYANNVPENKAYTGKIGRYLQLKDLLDGLSFFDIQYQIEGRRLIIK